MSGRDIRLNTAAVFEASHYFSVHVLQICGESKDGHQRKFSKKICSGKLRKNSLVVTAGAQIQTCLDYFMTSLQIFALRVL